MARLDNIRCRWCGAERGQYHEARCIHYDNRTSDRPNPTTDEKIQERLATAGKHTNPKEAFGNKKPPLSYLPMAGMLAQLQAQVDGGLKYGVYNFRDTQIEAMTYVEAALRHLNLYKVGEELTRDTRIKNLGGVMACCAILLDAEAHGTLIDNRRHSKIDADMLHEAETWIAMLKDMQSERDKANGKDTSTRRAAG